MRQVQVVGLHELCIESTGKDGEGLQPEVDEPVECGDGVCDCHGGGRGGGVVMTDGMDVAVKRV